MAAPRPGRNYQPDLMVPSVEEPIEVYVPGLTDPSLFVTLPMTDGITALLEKYVSPNQRPPRDLTGNFDGKTLDELIASHNWRAVANYCRTTILNTSADQTARILAHWTLRLHSLLRLHLLQPSAAELAALSALLPSPDYAPDAPLFHPAVPFELLVLRAALPGLRGAKEAAVEGLAELIRGAKSEYWATMRGGGGEAEAGVWEERVRRMGGLVEGLLGELKAGSSAADLAKAGEPSPALLSALCRQHYATGDHASLHATHATLAALPASDPASARAARKTAALAKIADGDWPGAEADWRALVADDPRDLEAVNNLAVSLLYQAKLNDALALLTGLLVNEPERVASSEPVLFNLATVQELRTEQAMAAKVGVLRTVAGVGGQGLRQGALKLVV